MARNANGIFLGLLMVAATVYLMPDPRCGKGCKTMLQHLLTCELEALL
jgi:hypothetical protein